MTVTCQIDSAAGIVYTTVQAPADAREIVEAIAMAVASPAFRPGLNGIADLRKATAQYSPKDLQWIADLLRALGEQIGPSRTAIILSDDASDRLARDFQSMSSGITVDTEVFRDLESARAWLAAPPDRSGPPSEGAP